MVFEASPVRYFVSFSNEPSCWATLPVLLFLTLQPSTCLFQKTKIILLYPPISFFTVFNMFFFQKTKIILLYPPISYFTTFNLFFSSSEKNCPLISYFTTFDMSYFPESKNNTSMPSFFLFYNLRHVFFLQKQKQK